MAVAGGVATSATVFLTAQTALATYTTDVAILAAILSGAICTLVTVWSLSLLGRRYHDDVESETRGPDASGGVPHLSTALTQRRTGAPAVDENPFRSPIEVGCGRRTRRAWAKTLWAAVLAFAGWFGLFLTTVGFRTARDSIIQRDLHEAFRANELAAEARTLLLAALTVLCLFFFACRKMLRFRGESGPVKRCEEAEKREETTASRGSLS